MPPVLYPKRPVEFYGQYVQARPQGNLARALQGQSCPFLNRRCVKQRKSNKTQTIGSCTIGYQEAPLIVCPHRFLEGNHIFLDVIHLLPNQQEYFIVPEITMPGGSIDYFLVGKSHGRISGYAGIEIQSLDTTGSGGIWQARVDLLHGNIGSAYPYGINWKMSAKTILVQLHHKASAFEVLGKKLILVVQSEFMNYVDKEFQTSQLRAANTNDSIHFHIYDLVMLGGKLALAIKEKKSTSVKGVEQMLRLGPTGGITEAEVVKRITKKMPMARRLQL